MLSHPPGVSDVGGSLNNIVRGAWLGAGFIWEHVDVWQGGYFPVTARSVWYGPYGVRAICQGVCLTMSLDLTPGI